MQTHPKYISLRNISMATTSITYIFEKGYKKRRLYINTFTTTNDWST